LGSSYLIFENPAAAFAILETRVNGKKMGPAKGVKTEAAPKAEKAPKAPKAVKKTAKKAAKKTSKSN